MNQHCKNVLKGLAWPILFVCTVFYGMYKGIKWTYNEIKIDLKFIDDVLKDK